MTSRLSSEAGCDTNVSRNSRDQGFFRSPASSPERGFFIFRDFNFRFPSTHPQFQTPDRRTERYSNQLKKSQLPDVHVLNQPSLKSQPFWIWRQFFSSPMTASLLHQKTVLILNRHWLPVSVGTPAEAFCALVVGRASALRVTAETFLALGWEEWRLLPTAGLPSVGTKGGRVLIPTVLVLASFGGVPLVRPGFGFRGLWLRDGGRCQYSGRRLAPHEADIDHVIPRSRGGANGWENCVISDRAINRRKGARTPEEARLKLLREPVVPRAVPTAQVIENPHGVEDWSHFLVR